MPPCSAPDTCWIYLIRHGATEHNLARPPRLQGRKIDDPLAGEGRRQAQRTAALLAGAALDAIFSSPLLRARQTAEAIALLHGLSIETVDDLVEVDVGLWEGMAWDRIEREHPKASRQFLADPAVHGYLGGENFQHVRDRVVPAMDRLMENQLGRTVAVVAHNVVNRCYLAHLLGIPMAHYRRITQDNCGVNLLRYRDGAAKLVTLNAVFHLDEQG
jgi:broad specificity phosphatase PhoE